MEQISFFAGTNRRVILGSPTKQCTSNRIAMTIRMPLTGESVVGMPDWLSEAYLAVSQFAREVSPQIENVSDIALAFANDGTEKSSGELFENPNAKAPNSEMKNFTVLRVGDPDGDPEVELQFKAYMPFARDLWRWVGEMGGKEVYMAFPSTTGKAVSIAKPATQPQLPLDEPSDVETEALADDRNPEDDPGSDAYEKQVARSMGAAAAAKPRLISVKPQGGKKNGPSELKSFHRDQAAKQAAKGKTHGRKDVN